MADRSTDSDCCNVDPHPEGWARLGPTLKRILARVPQHSDVSRPRFSVGTTTGTVLSVWAVLPLWAVLSVWAVLSALPPIRLSAQSDQLAVRFASMTAVTGLEQAMTDSLLALLPGSTRDRAGNVTLTLGQGAPKRQQ